MRRFAAPAFLLFALVALAAPARPAVAPEATIHDFYATLLQTMKRGPELGRKGRYEALAPAIRRTFDLGAMAQRAVGLGWTRLSAADQKRVTEAFARYTTATYADRFDSYSGERLEVTGEHDTPYGKIVNTRIVPSGGDPVSIDYLMRQSGEQWQIADVYLAGSVSQLATLRAQFATTLAQGGVDRLVDTLNRKAAELGASAAAL